jgi:hypothetical protein
LFRIDDHDLQSKRTHAFPMMCFGLTKCGGQQIFGSSSSRPNETVPNQRGHGLEGLVAGGVTPGYGGAGGGMLCHPKGFEMQMNGNNTRPPPAAAPVGTTMFDHALERETLRTECRRTTVTVAVLVILLLLMLALGALPESALPEFLAPFRGQGRFLTPLLAAYGIYEAGVRLWQGRLVHRGAPMPVAFRYLHVLVEVTLPTLALVVGADALGPHRALASSLPYLYFLFVFLTVLNLDGWLCAFSGVVAGAQFAAVSVVLLGVTSRQAADVATGTSILVDPHQCLVKGLLLGLTGLLAGFVARRIRHQIEEALRAVDERGRAEVQRE